jgi:hypothetical protein
MTVCKACGGQMSFAYLEKHVCPTPNPEYEKERDKYRQSEVERRARNERLGIKEIPSPPVWVCLEVVLLDRSVLKYAIRRDDFWLENQRLLIEPVLKAIGRNEYLGTQSEATAFVSSQMKQRHEMRQD